MKIPMNFQDQLILAPMAGVSDYSFRKLCVLWGADYCVTEMISAKALCFGDRKTAVLARVLKEELPLSVQIFGSEPEIVHKAAKLLSPGNYPHCMSDCLPTAIDFNMGCPVHKVISNGEGSALLKDEQRAKEVLEALVEGSALPVTVKIRAGFDSTHRNAPEIAAIAEKAGVSAVCVHGRTRDQLYRPGVDYEIIRQVKQTVSIPVIGNGDIFSPEDALRMKEKTGCDGLMIARGACGNPFLFSFVKAALRGQTSREVGVAERMQTAKKHLEWLIADKGERTGLYEARKHIAWYIKGLPGAPAFRDRINRTDNLEELFDILNCITDCSQKLNTQSGIHT